MIPEDIAQFIAREEALRKEAIAESGNPLLEYFQIHDIRLTRLESAWMLDHKKTLPPLERREDGSIHCQMSVSDFDDINE